MNRRDRKFRFLKVHRSLAEVLADNELASLGDSYVNFVYSLVLSIRKGQPSGARVKGSVLAMALKKAGLRKYMPSRISRHVLADAAEALVVYGWLHHCVTLEESVEILVTNEDVVEGICELLLTIKDRTKF